MTDADRRVRFDMTGLAADSVYALRARVNGILQVPVGRFRTLPAASGTPCNFTIAFAGDAETGSNHVVFDAIRAQNPLLFIHLGDMHYQNITDNDREVFISAYETVLRQPRQAALYREVPTVYVWDDHDYGPGDSDATSPSRLAAASAYRARVPHYPLVDSIGIYHAFDVGRVRFLVTDQRSAATPDGATDNASKSMLGAAQKAWFKNQLSNSPGKLIVWVCPRWFQPGPSTMADHWGAFSTERRELADHIKVNCHGRVIVLSADLHTMGIDDGSHEDFSTGGGEPLPTFQAAPLDQSPISFGAQFSEGGEFTNRGQFGTMQIADSGGSSISVTWKARDSTGAVLANYSFLVAV